jgi:nucleoside-diphosphate kinase
MSISMKPATVKLDLPAARPYTPRPFNAENAMAIEKTFAILKPDCLEKGLIGKVLAHVEESGLKPIAMRLTHLSRAEAEGFYAVHRERPFFKSLCDFMTSGPVVLMVLEGENAIARWREVMGATNPANAAPGTIRKLYANEIEKNTVHGSDAPATAAFEIGWFFAGVDLHSYGWKR